VRIALSLLAALLPALAACRPEGDADPGESMPTAEERLAEWEALPEGTSVPVAIGFAGPLPDPVIAELLTRYSLRPYVVYMVAAGMGSSLQRERSRASLEVLGEAREQAVSQMRTALCAQPGRARAMAEAGGDDVERGRQMLAYVDALQRAVPGLEQGEPAIYAVEAVGAAADVRALDADPQVTSWEPGWRGRIEGVDTVVTPTPPAAPQIGPVVDSAVLALSADEVRARLADLAENELGSCESATPSDEPR
jgi:hypothetical protein